MKLLNAGNHNLKQRESSYDKRIRSFPLTGTDGYKEAYYFFELKTNEEY